MRISNYIICLLLASTVFLLPSCKEESIDPEDFDLGTDYAPLSEGQSRTFEVSRVLFQTSSTDTTIRFMKEVLGESYENGGEEVYPINVYFKDSADGDWSLDSLWTVYRNDVNLVRTENGTAYQRLLFPLTVGDSWDMDAYNIQAEDMVTYESALESHAVNGTSSYSDVIVTSHNLVNNLIDYSQREFYYARNIGLIYRKEEITSQQPGQTKEGYSIIYKLIAYEE